VWEGSAWQFSTVRGGTFCILFFFMQSPTTLHRILLRWYAESARDFPWRRTRDPYTILVSEIMLQQTQADRVEILLPRLLKRFPTVEILARARRNSVIKAWRGMGYNRRAVHLHEAAKTIVRNGGIFPSGDAALRALPGVGRYTASAIQCFAFGERVPVVDVNIRRVLSRIAVRRRLNTDLFDEHAVWNKAAELLPQKNWYEWNQALMDIGARWCKARTTFCDTCPLVSCCASAHTVVIATKKISPAEKSHRGIPLRIWRGRVIEALRSKSYSSIRALEKAIGATGTSQDAQWLKQVIRKLEKDGLVKWTTHKIQLA